jgi:uncharacterized protein YktB (UPF0637 family)|tara:strand:- start:360 stop:680 length:321 start_codon:yes stop_codon:yes gene_type:complete
MKISELRKLIKEEILKEMAVNEMAKIQGELKTAIEKVIDGNEDLTGLELKKKIRGNEKVKDILDKNDEDLFDNQLNRFIKVKKGELELKKRGRKKGGKNKPKDEKK